MPRKPTPADKQRVRTGCLTCRKRRRKCDEQKPRCANCEVKGFTCKYGSDLAFVTRSGQISGAREGYKKITFVDDSPASVKESKSRQQSAPSRSDLQDNLDHDIPFQNEDIDPVGLNSILAPDVPIHYPPGLGDIEFAGGRTSVSYHGHLGFAGSYRRLVRTPPENTSYETDLLRHFRYHVGPWMDTGDSNCALGVQVLLLSRSNRPLQSAILALSAGQRSLLSLTHTEDVMNMLRFRKEAEESLALRPELERHVGNVLLLVQELLPSGLHQWRNLILPQFEHPRGFISPLDLAEELGESLFWFYFRLDLAASLCTRKAPIISFPSFLQRDGSPIHTSKPLQSNTARFHQHALCLLGHCLALIYGDPNLSSPQASSSLAGFPSLRQSHFLSQWTFLWTDCQKWYNERSVDTQQILDIRGGEADQIDPAHDSSFPILILTTPVALVANVVYHITSLLLLTHKPRLLKSLPGPRCYTSHIWHAQAIAGIAASNDSPEQWDPVLVAGLLLIAKDMTHESQQTVLLERLKKITATTGINLEHETELLQSAWRVARYDDLEE
ncbi:hypothetical protein N7520_005314 [Penicillium odoratum]|uniref:uncharacterized protein n=1 Tax=Penicillium odoratum TaxID=1167516 RepID=UPI002547E530|nr:uncharacterized protein N7520_005314 [Penicillium odoratum]KAJ5765755.1 hypothetical protein N7520_005314 [Penicillium odoratum]